MWYIYIIIYLYDKSVYSIHNEFSEVLLEY